MDINSNVIRRLEQLVKKYNLNDIKKTKEVNVLMKYNKIIGEKNE